jgi:L-alanine-DL-glutamate epimerase-like enolase superfamily enzyme
LDFNHFPIGMAKHSDIRIKEAICSFEPIAFRAPLKFGGRVIDKSWLINVEVVVENKAGKHQTGLGSMPVGNVWAWPSDKVSTDQAEAVMKNFAEQICDLVTLYPDYSDPIDIVYHISGEYTHLGKRLSQEAKLPEIMPELAELVAASPLDAAIHDGFGRINHCNSYNALSKEFIHEDLATYLDEQFKGEFLDQYTLREPKPRMPLYHLVGALDPLTDADITKRINDKLPETLPEWINQDGLTHFKIKLNGDDLDWDVNRVLAVEKVTAETQAKRGCSEWVYSLDFNEKCQDAAYVLEFLARIQQSSPAAYDRIQYIEQPTSRNLKAHPELKLHEISRQKPVVLDEGLIDYESLLLAREMGYTGVALKACKGQTESLILAAAAQKLKMFLCVQDLSCPGYSFLHSASLSARIPTVAAIEGNSRQYCPAGNKPFAKRFPSMFNIKDGTVGTAVLNGDGLGF